MCENVLVIVSAGGGVVVMVVHRLKLYFQDYAQVSLQVLTMENKTHKITLLAIRRLIGQKFLQKPTLSVT